MKPEDGTTQVVTPELVGTEEVPAVERRALNDVLEVEIVVRVRREKAGNMATINENEEDQARHGELMPEEAHTGVRPLASGLQLDAALVAERQVRVETDDPSGSDGSPTRPRSRARPDAARGHADSSSRPGANWSCMRQLLSHSGCAGRAEPYARSAM